MTPRTLLPLCLALLFWACQPKDPLPRATQFGANTFGCKIDGKTYIPDGGKPFSGLKPIEGGFFRIQSNSGQLGIYIRTYASTGEVLSIYISSYKSGTYKLDNSVPPSPYTPYPYHYAEYENSSGQSYMTSSTNTGQVVITKSDTLAGIISGNFHFQAGAVDLNGRSNGTGTVNITEGRFDIGLR